MSKDKTDLIPINDDWAFEMDKYCVILKRRRLAEKGKNAGQYVWDDVAYYAGIKQMLRGLVKHEVHACNSLLEIAAKLDELYALIEGLEVQA
jgi:hypothetical protein